MSEQEKQEVPPAAVSPSSDDASAGNEAIEEAKSRIKLAWTFAAISASLTTLFGLAGFFFTDLEGPLAFFVDPWSLVDAVVIWILAYFLYKRSFTASLFMVAYWLLSMFAIHLETGLSASIIVRLYFLYVFVNGSRGAYTLRKMEPRKPGKRGWRIAGWAASGLVATIILILIAVGTLIEQGFMPSTEVENGESLPDRILQKLRSEGIITRSETVDLFYSAGFMDVMEDGNLITNERVISYWRNETEELNVVSASFGDISDVYIAAKGDGLNDTVMTVTQHDGEQFQLVLPVAANGDNRFYHRINQLIAHQPET